MTAEEFYDRFEFNSSMSGSLLGRGGFSSVYKVYDKVRKRYVAIKRSEVGSYTKFDLDREVKLANEIEYHPNIIRYENVERITDRAGTYDYAILKYYTEGNLDQVLASYTLDDQERRQILTGILRGLAHLHSIPIIHRDFKAANVLMDRDLAGNWIPIIADFGLSRLVDADMSYVLNNSQIAITPNYASPEQYKENDALRPNTDLWAFGVMTYKMMIGKLPFRVEGVSGEKDTSHKIRTMVLEGKLPRDINTIQEPYKTIIAQCLMVNPAKRVKRAEDLLVLLEKQGKKAETRPQKPAYDGKTQIHKEIKTAFDPVTQVQARNKEVSEPFIPVPKTKSTWKIALSVVGFLVISGLLFWFFNRPQPKVAEIIQAKPKIEEKPVTTTDSVITAKVIPLKKVIPVKRGPIISKSGSLIIYSKYHDLKVYIDGRAQQENVRAGETNTYKLPVGEGVFYKVEYVDTGLMPDAEPLNVKAGEVYKRSFTEKIN